MSDFHRHNFDYAESFNNRSDLNRYLNNKPMSNYSYNNRGYGYGQQPQYGYGQQPQYRQNNYQPRYQPQQQTSRKKSGAKLTRFTITKGPNAGAQRQCTSGWNISRSGGINTFLCCTTNKSQDTGKGWVGSVACEVINKATNQKAFYWGTMQISTGKVVINDLGIVLNPKAPNGGYCGKFTQSKRR